MLCITVLWMMAPVVHMYGGRDLQPVSTFLQITCRHTMLRRLFSAVMLELTVVLFHTPKLCPCWPYQLPVHSFGAQFPSRVPNPLMSRRFWAPCCWRLSGGDADKVLQCIEEAHVLKGHTVDLVGDGTPKLSWQTYCVALEALGKCMSVGRHRGTRPR